MLQPLPFLSNTPGHPLSFLWSFPFGLQHCVWLQSLAIWSRLSRHLDRHVDRNSIGPNLALPIHPSAQRPRAKARRKSIRARVPAAIKYCRRLVLCRRFVLVWLDHLPFGPLDSPDHWDIVLRHRHHPDICRDLHFSRGGIPAVCGKCVVSELFRPKLVRRCVPPLRTTNVQYTWFPLGYHTARMFDIGDGTLSLPLLHLW